MSIRRDDLVFPTKRWIIPLALLASLLLSACDSGPAPAATPVSTTPGSGGDITPSPATTPGATGGEVYLRVAAATASSFDTTPGFAPRPMR
jgi:hypothetical protein